MTDKAWKPKRVSEGTTDSSSPIPVVEISVRTPDCQTALEEIIKAIPDLRLKKSGETTAAALVIMELDENPEDTFSTIRELVRVTKGIEIFLTSATLDSTMLLEAMRAGAKEYLSQPIQKKEVENAIQRFQERLAASTGKSEEKRKLGRMLTFFGGKGGVGTTSVAVNLAAALQELPGKPTVALVDVNQHGGDLPLYLDLQPKHSFRDIAADLSRLDQTFLMRILTKSESGLFVLPSGYDDLSTGRLAPDCVEATLRLLQSTFDYVVIDCGHVLDLTTKKALELADFIMVTSTLLVPVVHRTKRILELLRGSGFPVQKLRLIMNRYLSAEQDVLHETEEILKQKTAWVIPNDYPSISQAVNSGKALIYVAPRSAAAKAFRDWAVTFTPKAAQASSKGTLMGWLNPFKGRQVESSTSRA